MSSECVFIFPCCAFFCYFLCHMIMIVIFGNVVAYNSAFNTLQIEQLKLEWQTPFIKEVYMVDYNTGCKGEDQPILSMPWQGIAASCL